MKELNWAEEIAEKIINKSEVVASRNKKNIPYTTIDGKFDNMVESNFC